MSLATTSQGRPMAPLTWESMYSKQPSFGHNSDMACFTVLYHQKRLSNRYLESNASNHYVRTRLLYQLTYPNATQRNYPSLTLFQSCLVDQSRGLSTCRGHIDWVKVFIDLVLLVSAGDGGRHVRGDARLTIVRLERASQSLSSSSGEVHHERGHHEACYGAADLGFKI